MNQDAIRKVSGRHGEPPPCDWHPDIKARMTDLITGESLCNDCYHARLDDERLARMRGDK